MRFPNRFFICVALSAAACGVLRGEDAPIHNTQKDAPPLSTPEEALKAITVPKGFRVTLFAAEPDVRQPIAITTDARGRLWVAENYTYAERPVTLDDRHRDRIVVLEDTDGDGRSDRRFVFWDQARQLTSVEMGFGGVWAMCPPQLLFLPDRDGDGRLDGEPQVILDGFDVGPANRHNFANGLKWGPDGWLYGRNGISNVGRVGAPGTLRQNRVEIGPGVWRYHPQTKAAELVCTGTTNPWGHDWDDHGELFFINTVIGHLWHGVPGAHFKRMFGVDSNPHVYELIDQTADHVHWDTSEAWNEAKKGLSKTTDQAGGGHAHCGMMVYLGDNWPAEYRGRMFTLNMHGRRINSDRLKRNGASYVGEHAADFLFSQDVWFRGTELVYGQDGGVFVADWSDVGECHENDGVHRGSGRIFKITYIGDEADQDSERSGTSGKPNPTLNLAELSDAELIALQTNRNDWYVRHARRLLHERAANSGDMSKVHKALRKLYRENPAETRKLRALWALHVTGGLSEDWLLEQLARPSEHVRAWAVRLLCDHEPPSPAAIDSIATQAAKDPSGLVLLYYASSLQRIPAAERWPLAIALAARGDFADDRVLPLMLWYGVEAALPEYPDRAVSLAVSTRVPLVRRFVSRRLTQDLESQPAPVNRLAASLADVSDDRRRDVLSGMNEALRGWRKAEPPPAWIKVQSKLRESKNEEVRRLAREIAVVFGDGRALDELKRIAASNEAEVTSRRSAVRSLVVARAEGVSPLLKNLLANRELSAEAVRGLAVMNEDGTSKLLLEEYAGLYTPAREAVVEALAARPASALSLLEAVESGAIDRRHVSVFQIRQMQAYDDPRVRSLVKKVWPDLRPISADKKAAIEKLKRRLTKESLESADASAGRAIFELSCAKCHRLFGRGGRIGPDITGAQRFNVDYLLENVVDPGATLAVNYRMTTIALADGRIVRGVVLAKSDKTWQVQTPKDKILIPADDILEAEPSRLSLMPEGQLDVLKPEEIRDLFAYLMSPRQVALRK